MHKIDNEIVAGINFNLTVGMDIYIYILLIFFLLLGIIFIHVYISACYYIHTSLFLLCAYG